MKHKFFLIALAFTNILSTTTMAGTITCDNDEACSSGTCGTGCKFTISDKTLTITGSGYSSIKNGAFSPHYTSSGSYRYNTDTRLPEVTEVVVSGTISSIGNNAFYRSGLTSVTLPNSITNIGNESFWQNNLTSITIPNSVTTIGNNSFSYNKLTSLTIPDSVTTIDQFAFNNNELTSVTLPKSITKIAAGVFQNNQITSVIIPDSVTTIESYAFSNNNLEAITIPNLVTEIGNYAFNKNNLTSVSIADSVTKIGIKAFEGAFATDLTVSADNLQRYLDASGGFTDSGSINLQCTNGDCQAVLEAWDAAKGTNYASRLTSANSNNTDSGEETGDADVNNSDDTGVSEGSDSPELVTPSAPVRNIKRIYTVEEAAALSKKEGNTFRLRYK